MAAFDSFDYLLNRCEPGALWSDEESDQAYILLERFWPEDWIKLQNTWRKRSESWQELLADALSGAPAGFAAPLLLEIIKSSSDEVAEIAGDSLRVLEPDDAEYEVTAEVRQRLQTLFARRDRYNTDPFFTELLPRLKVK